MLSRYQRSVSASLAAVDGFILFLLIQPLWFSVSFRATHAILSYCGMACAGDGVSFFFIERKLNIEKQNEIQKI